MSNLILGNAVEHLDKLEYDLVVTSPPYDNLRTYDNYDEWSWDTFTHIAKPLSASLKDGGVIVWNVADATLNGSETGSSFRQALFFMDNCGLRLHDTMIYYKAGCPFPAGRHSKRYSNHFEYMFVFSKGAPKATNLIADKPNKWGGTPQVWGKSVVRQKDGSLKEDKRAGKTIAPFGVRENVWKIHAGAGAVEKDKSRAQHPATMPYAMARDHIITWSNEGDVVLDPFMGSGTTGIACNETNREFIGIEINPDYFNLAVSRV